MPTDVRHRALAACIAFAMTAMCARAQLIQNEPPKPAQDLDVVEKLGASVPLGLELIDDHGRHVTLGDSFKPGRPVILAMGYYDCPLLCLLLFDGLAKSLAPLSYTPAEDYQVAVVSFDPDNTTKDAYLRKQAAIEHFPERAGAAADGWVFHTTTDANARALAESVGYQYRPIPGTSDFAHGAVIMILTPDGRVSRYLFGLDFPERDLRLALLEASDGEIAQSVGDYFLHLCYRWDGDGYTLAAFRVMQFGASAGAVVLAGVLVWLKVGERRRKRTKGEATRPIIISPSPRLTEPSPRP